MPARTRDDVLTAMADVLGVEGAASSSATELGAHLADRSMLIVLDNCEHVVDAVAELIDVAISYGGTWRIVATTREPLGLRDEHLVPVEPLGAAAAELFVERARRLEPRASWDPANELIVDLCARLDGLPLAVELAAGQVRRWSLAELSRRIVDPPNDCRCRPLAVSLDTRPWARPSSGATRCSMDRSSASSAISRSSPPASSSTPPIRCGRSSTTSRSTRCWLRWWTRASWCV